MIRVSTDAIEIIIKFDLLVETPGSTSRSTAPGVARTAAEIASMTCDQSHHMLMLFKTIFFVTFGSRPSEKLGTHSIIFDITDRL